MNKKKNFYVVWEGHQKGIYDTWDGCQKQIKGFPNAKYKAFATLLLAEEAIKNGYKRYITIEKKDDILSLTHSDANFKPIIKSISVDAACNVPRRIMEYQGVCTWNKKLIFKQGPFENATNNIGEFLAIVHALAYCKKGNIDLPIYTDSSTALVWVKKKKANTKQEQKENNSQVFELIERAENWLKENTFTNPLLKWHTDKWGEIPADFGRK